MLFLSHQSLCFNNSLCLSSLYLHYNHWSCFAKYSCVAGCLSWFLTMELYTLWNLNEIFSKWLKTFELWRLFVTWELIFWFFLSISWTEATSAGVRTESGRGTGSPDVISREGGREIETIEIIGGSCNTTWGLEGNRPDFRHELQTFSSVMASIRACWKVFKKSILSIKHWDPQRPIFITPLLSVVAEGENIPMSRG